jgi:hypothetical protein
MTTTSGATTFSQDFKLKLHGADVRDRTGDLVLTKDVLYQLSYVSEFALERVMGIEPMPSAWKAEVLPLNYTRRWQPQP